MNEVVLSLQNINKTFHQGSITLDVLKDISLDIHKGEIISLVGPSGCGKSTLLQIAGLLDNADSGTITINQQDVTDLRDKQRTLIRRHDIGYIYQFHHLLPEFSACENVIIPQIIAGKKKKEAREFAEHLLEDVGLAERISHQPSQLSGGEKQRVAIARALANNPAILLADEPTGNLDPEASDNTFALLLERVKKHDCAMLMVTHDQSLGKKADKIVTITQGSLHHLP